MRKKLGDNGLAGRIKSLRERRSLSQEKLAELADISLSLLQKIEHAWILGSKVTHEKLARALGTTSSYLVYGDTAQSLELPLGLTPKDVEFLRYIASYLAESNGVGRTSSTQVATEVISDKPHIQFAQTTEEDFAELEKDAEFLTELDILEEIYRLTGIIIQKKKKS